MWNAALDEGLEDEVRKSDPYRWLASRFIDSRAARADVVAIYAFDHEIARARRVASSPLIAEIRLTWWCEVLDEAFSGSEVRAHPVARALALAVRRGNLARQPLQAMIDARFDALDPVPMGPDELDRWALAVGGSAAEIAARILDPAAAAAAVSAAGRIWGLVMATWELNTEPGQITRLLKLAFMEAEPQVASISAAAFPAVVQATLARGGPPVAGESGGPGARLKLLWAVPRGRL